MDLLTQVFLVGFLFGCVYAGLTTLVILGYVRWERQFDREYDDV